MYFYGPFYLFCLICDILSDQTSKNSSLHPLVAALWFYIQFFSLKMLLFNIISSKMLYFDVLSLLKNISQYKLVSYQNNRFDLSCKPIDRFLYDKAFY